uniref:Uncharacterized protein n=1 Tax=Wuchereria bancrofti TaxID=6293 RepID=A0AAF5PQA2_WUCBA
MSKVQTNYQASQLMRARKTNEFLNYSLNKSLKIRCNSPRKLSLPLHYLDPRITLINRTQLHLIPPRKEYQTSTHKLISRCTWYVAYTNVLVPCTRAQLRKPENVAKPSQLNYQYRLYSPLSYLHFFQAQITGHLA